MRVSYENLGRWVDLSTIDDTDELAHRLTMAGLEVEDVVRFGQGHDDIVVGFIESIDDHPKADRLVICRVDAGEGELRQIVCGATNMKAGDKVPVALPGSEPPALDFAIGERKVLGVQSAGMLCSEEELGLADHSDGLMILPPDLEVGTPIFKAMGLVDTHFEIGLTPNRPDCLSHVGVAREVAAIYGVPFDASALKTTPAWTHGVGDVADAAALAVDDPDGCPRYVAVVIEDVKVGPSPLWLQRMVTAMGMRSINNVVDVTNAVLADIGQPLHSFDLDKLAEHRIVVRRAKPGEKLEAIDHKTYELDPTDLVIADANEPVAIAGVMGGVGSEVTEETTRILLECAYFAPTTVRRTSKRLGIHSESSHRFERGIDPGATLQNAAYAVEMLLRTHEELDAEPTVRAGVLDFEAVPAEPAKIDLEEALVERILGIAIAPDDIERMLEAIEVKVDRVSGGWHATVPTFRPDLERPIDLVEEIARLWGYDRFEATLPRASMGAAHELRPDARHEETIVTRQTLRATERVRTRLLGAGFHEAVSYSFFADEALDQLDLPEDDERRNVARVANPLSRDQAVMRTTLLPGLIAALRTNVAQRESDVALFEVGRRFFADRREIQTLSMLATGTVRQHYSERRPWDFFDLKGLIEALVGRGPRCEWRIPEPIEPFLHPGVQAELLVDDEPIGVVGQLHPGLVSDLELDAPVLVAELDFGTLLATPADDVRFEELARFPAVTRDFALLCDRNVRYATLEEAINSHAERDAGFGKLFRGVRLFDVYEGPQVPEGSRSLALQVTYRAADRTLTDEEVAAADQGMLDALREQVDVQLR